MCVYVYVADYGKPVSNLEVCVCVCVCVGGEGGFDGYGDLVVWLCEHVWGYPWRAWGRCGSSVGSRGLRGCGFWLCVWERVRGREEELRDGRSGGL